MPTLAGSVSTAPPREVPGILLTNMGMKNTINIYDYNLSETCTELQKAALTIVAAGASCPTPFITFLDGGYIVLCSDRNGDSCSGIRSMGSISCYRNQVYILLNINKIE